MNLLQRNTIRLAAMVAVGGGCLASLFEGADADDNITYPPPCVMGDESIMSQKAHGTSETPVQSDLLYNVDQELADSIANYNRHYAEESGYWETTSFLNDVGNKGPVTFYDSNTGKALFVIAAPGTSRSFEEFVTESQHHGWPSFRDDEVAWENVRVLPNGETVSLAGTHLGHNLPDDAGSRYCIDLVSIAGHPQEEEEENEDVTSAVVPSIQAEVSTIERDSSTVITNSTAVKQTSSMRGGVASSKIGILAATVIGSAVVASIGGAILSVKLMRRLGAFSYDDVPMESSETPVFVIS